MNNKILVFSFLFLFNLTTSNAQAALAGIELKAYAGLKGLYGDSLTDGGFEKERSMLVFGGDAVLGVRWKMLVLGGGASYSWWNQLKDPAELNGSNTEGVMKDYSAVLGVQLLNFTLLGKYIFNSTYELAEKNRAGQQITYFDPSGAFALQLQMKISPFTYVGLEYTKTTYQKQEVNGAELDLSSEKQLKFSGLGVIYGINW